MSARIQPRRRSAADRARANRERAHRAALRAHGIAPTRMMLDYCERDTRACWTRAVGPRLAALILTPS